MLVQLAEHALQLRSCALSGQVLQPQKKESEASGKLLNRDLDSSLATLTDSKLVVSPGLTK